MDCIKFVQFRLNCDNFVHPPICHLKPSSILSFMSKYLQNSYSHHSLLYFMFIANVSVFTGLTRMENMFNVISAKHYITITNVSLP